MPQAKSLKQWRFMKIIQEGNYDAAKAPDRGGPPKQIADKYTSPGKGAPDYSPGPGPSRGGSWSHSQAAGWHEKKMHEAVKEGKHEEAAEHAKRHKFHSKALSNQEKKKAKNAKKSRTKAHEHLAAGKYNKAKKGFVRAEGHEKHGHFTHHAPHDTYRGKSRANHKGVVEHTARHEHYDEAKHSGGKAPRARSAHFKEGAFNPHHGAPKKKLKKSDEAFEAFYKGMGAGVIVLDKEGRILIGKQDNGLWSTPGGHVEDHENHEDAALRELNEETGLNAHALGEMVHEGRLEGNHSKTFVVRNFSGKLKDSDELRDHKFVAPHELPENLRHCSAVGIKSYLASTMNKSLTTMVALERLEKNILRGPDGRSAVYEMTHGESLKLVGSGIFKMLKKIVQDMKDEDFRQVNIGEYVFHIRKHMNDVYSGRVEDGHKLVHQFANRSLPQIAADLMSLFEWYAPEDEDVFNYIKDDIDDEVIHGGIQKLVDNYKRHNIGEIYGEMDQIREEIRRGVAVDLQQVEGRMMKLFDKLDKLTSEMAGKHSALEAKADADVSLIEKKLAELQTKLDELGAPKKSEVTAVSSVATPAASEKILDEYYPYLPKPEVHISPDGKIKIVFGDSWNHMEKENFLNDLKAKVIKKQNG